MNAFGELVASPLHSQGYWTKTGVKVGVQKQEKRDIGTPSAPRGELGVLAYQPVDS